MSVALLLTVVLALAYANGANDDFKGVATLFGSGTTNYRGALFGIGTVTRQAGAKMIATVLAAWVTTLPTAALLAAVGFRVFSTLG